MIQSNVFSTSPAVLKLSAKQELNDLSMSRNMTCQMLLEKFNLILSKFDELSIKHPDNEELIEMWIKKLDPMRFDTLKVAHHNGTLWLQDGLPKTLQDVYAKSCTWMMLNNNSHTPTLASTFFIDNRKGNNMIRSLIPRIAKSQRKRIPRKTQRSLKPKNLRILKLLKSRRQNILVLLVNYCRLRKQRDTIRLTNVLSKRKLQMLLKAF